MKRIFTLTFCMLFLLSLNLSSFANESTQIIAKINSEDISQQKFDRLLNAQKKKLIEQLINETLILQEAKARNINAPEEEITKRLNLIKEKQGGEESFNKFLSENNATLKDARNEIKNQILLQLTKNQINNVTSFLAEKKSKSNIVIYTDKIFPRESDEETNNILAREIQEETSELNIRNKEYLVIDEQPQGENKIFISDIKEDTIIEPINVTAKPNEIIQDQDIKEKTETVIQILPSQPPSDTQNRIENSSKILKELRRKLEQRRVVNR